MIKTELQILADYRHSCNINNFERIYHIKINDDGSVYDYDSHLAYDTLLTWARNYTHHLIAMDKKA